MDRFLSEHRIVFVRHPETVANVEGRLVGRGDSPLTDRGTNQIAQIATLLGETRIDRVMSSPLKRAKVLAAQIAAVHDLVVEPDGRLQEIDFGSAEGLLHSDLPKRGITIDYDSYARPIVLGGESRTDVDRRVADFLRETTAKQGVTCVVSHGGTIRSAIATLLELRPTDCWAFHIPNGAIITMSISGGRGILEEMIVAG